MNRLAWLDGCRALAALLVVFMHVTEVWTPYVMATDTLGQGLVWATHQMNIGVLGVYIFFLVSGFVIPYSVREEGVAASKVFGIRRFFRLMPLFWFSIPLGVLTTHWLWHKPFGLDALVANMLMVPNFVGLPFAEGLYWSLQVEIAFYLLVAALVYSKRFASCHILLLFIVVSVLQKALGKAGLDGVAVLPVFTLILDMLSIILIGWVIQRVFGLRQARWSDWVMLAYVGYSYFIKKPMLAWHFYSHGERWLDHIAVSLSLLVLMGFMYFNLHSRLLSYLGKISYSLYLMHPVVMYILLYQVATNPQSALHAWPLPAVLALVYALTILLSHFSWRYIEQPTQQFGKRLIERMRQLPASATPNGERAEGQAR